MVMKLKDLLLQKRSLIIKKWLESILNTYPSDTKMFLKKKKNQFANPVGHIIAGETENLYDILLDEGVTDREKLSQILDRIIRIRSVQDFSPSQSLLFIHALKDILKEELIEEIRGNDLFEDLFKFYEKIDNVALVAFDIYAKCRETIYEIKAEQAKKQVSGLLRRAGLVCELPEWDPNQKDGNIENDRVTT
jgi:hypothetical protein